MNEEEKPLLLQLTDDMQNAHNITVTHRTRSYRLSDENCPWQAEVKFVKMRIREYEAQMKMGPEPPAQTDTDPAAPEAPQADPHDTDPFVE